MIVLPLWLVLAQAPLDLRFSGCDAELATEARHMLEVELSGEPHDTGEIEAACEGETVRVTLRPASGAALTRPIVLSGMLPRARGRLLALTIAEFLAEGRQTPEVRGAPPVVRVEPAQEVAPPRTPASTWWAAAGAEGQWLAAGLMGGFIVNVGWRFGGRWLVRASGFGGWSTAPRQLGTVKVVAFGGSLGAGAQVAWHFIAVEPWLGLRVAGVRLEGVAAADAVAGSVTGGWLGPQAGADVVLFPLERFQLRLGLSGGYAVLGVRGRVEQESDVVVAGAWGALSLMAALAW